MAKHILPVKVDHGDGPVVVLLHGLGNNHKSWSFVLKHLDKSVRVIALDLLGFGGYIKATGKIHAGRKVVSPTSYCTHKVSIFPSSTSSSIVLTLPNLSVTSPMSSYYLSKEWKSPTRHGRPLQRAWGIPSCSLIPSGN